MKKMLRLLGLASVLTPLTVSADILGDRTFIAHRDELSYHALEWITNNHYKAAKTKTVLGGTLTATPFYSASSNGNDLAALFGIGKTGTINVQNIELDTTTGASHDNLRNNLHEGIYSFNIDHCPNCDGATTGYIPMHGVLTLNPARRVWGTYLGWDQSLDNIAKGLRISAILPVVDVATSLRPDDRYATASHVPATDGITGKTLRDYFSGSLVKGTAITPHVVQKALTRGKIANDFVHAFGLADFKLRLDWQCLNYEKFAYSLGVSLQLPTGTTVANEYMFEPILGARGHVALGYNGLFSLHAYKNDDVTVRVDLSADTTYFFEATERRLVSVWDKTNKVVMPASPYRLVMRNKYCGVQPAANVMSLDHTVKPGFQFDGLLGVSTQWKNWTIDVAYNLYWHQAEKVELKNTNTWADDQYAFAHNHYDMTTVTKVTPDAARNQVIMGGTSLTSGGAIVHITRAGTSTYNDSTSPILKHQNLIGANGENLYASSPTRIADDHTDDSSGNFPGAFTSMNGPIQNAGHNSSSLINQTVAAPTGVTQDGSGTQSVMYQITSAYAATAAQITHSFVGGVSYCFPGKYPIFIGVGGLAEVQESNRNSAIENFKVWTKVGIQF